MSPADVRAMKRKAKQGQVRSAGVMPKYRIGALTGTDRSKRTVNKAKVDTREVKIHYDFNHLVTQDQVAYFGFSDAGSTDHQLKHGCLALALMIYRRAGAIVAHEDINVQHTNLLRIDAIKIQFHGVESDGTTTHFENLITDGISSGTKTLAGLRDAIVAVINARVLDGAWPVTMQILKIGAIDYDILQMYDLTNVMIHFNAMQKYKYQNVTPATDGGTNLNDVQANPLSGRLYQFKNITPRLRAIVKEADEKDTPLDNLAKIEDIANTEGNLACEAFRTTSLYSAALKLGFRQPPKAVSIFSNCSHEDKVYMPPGGYKQLIKKTSVKMNFKRFVIACAVYSTPSVPERFIGLNNDTRVSRIGTSTMWALEPAVRTSASEQTKIIVNRELWLTAKAVVGANRQPVRSKTVVSDGGDFGA